LIEHEPGLRWKSSRARRSCRDGTTALLFEPIELLERLAVLTPRRASR
jgi:hypothetical protein